MTTRYPQPPVNVVYDLYGGDWRKWGVASMSSHPAKFSRKLIFWIYAHGMDKGWWRKGDTVVDPMAGVGCGGLAAAYNQLRWLGVELEDKVVAIANQTFAAHHDQLEQLHCPQPKIVQGDSRFLDQSVIALADGIAVSPPYGNRVDDSGTGPIGSRNGKYGKRKGQIGNMRGWDGVAMSPPFTEPSDRNRYKVGATGEIAGHMGRAYTVDHTGNSEGQVGRMGIAKAIGGVGDAEWGGDQGLDITTYWGSMFATYRHCYYQLKIGGVMAVVIKDFVRGGKVVPVCDTTLRLLQSIGFIGVERTLCMLVGGTDGKSHKSFFRRDLERKGVIPPIDYEQVLWVQKQ